MVHSFHKIHGRRTALRQKNSKEPPFISNIKSITAGLEKIKARLESRLMAKRFPVRFSAHFGFDRGHRACYILLAFDQENGLIFL